MLRKFIEDNKEITRIALGCNVLKISSDKKTIECLNAKAVEKISLLLNDPNPEIRRLAQLHFALAMLEARNKDGLSQTHFNVFKTAVLNQEEQLVESISVSTSFINFFRDENHILLRIIFRYIHIDEFEMNSFPDTAFQQREMEILADVFATANIKTLGWNPFTIPITKIDLIKRIQGKIPGIKLFPSSNMLDGYGFQQVLRALTSLPTVNSVECSSLQMFARYAQDIILILGESSVVHFRPGSFGSMTENERHLNIDLALDDVRAVGHYVRTRVKKLDLSRNKILWKEPGSEVNKKASQIIFNAIANSSIEELLIDCSGRDDALKMRSICAAISKCKTLTKLTISNCVHISYAPVSQNPYLGGEIGKLQLESVSLSGFFVREMSDEGVASILKLLDNPSMQELHFGDLDWPITKWKILFDKVANSSLRRLKIPFFGNFDLRWPTTDTRTAMLWQAFCDAIRYSRLRAITFIGNTQYLEQFLDLENSEMLVYAIIINGCITDIFINDRPLPNIPAFADIHEVLKRNRKIRDTCQALNDFAFALPTKDTKKEKEKAEAVDTANIITLSNTVIAQFTHLKTIFPTLKVYSETAVKDLLQPALVKFLEKLLRERGWLVKALLTLLPANHPDVKNLYKLYAKAECGTSYSIKLIEDPIHSLFRAVKYFFDSEDQFIQFEEDEVQSMDNLLLSALRSSGVAIKEINSAELRLALWQYLILSLLPLIGKEAPTWQIDLAKPLTQIEIDHIYQAWEKLVRELIYNPNEKTKHFFRGFDYVYALYYFQFMQKKIISILSLNGDASQIRFELIKLLPRYLNAYHQPVKLSAPHQQLFDRLLIKASGCQIEVIAHDEQRLFCLQSILLLEVNPKNAKAKPNIAAFYQPASVVGELRTEDHVKAVGDATAKVYQDEDLSSCLKPLANYIAAFEKQMQVDGLADKARYEVCRAVGKATNC